VIDGYVSRHGAREDYAVVLIDNPDSTLRIDVGATTALRASTLGQDRARQENRERIVRIAAQRSAGIALSEQAKREIVVTEERIGTILQLLEQRGHRDDSAAPGKSLRNPFLNARALKFWGIDSMDRWLNRHQFD